MVGVPTTDSRSSPEAPARLWQMPQPATDDRMVAGVAAGIADELGLDPMVVRVAFAVLAVAGGWGVVLYLGAWLAMWAWPGERPSAPRPPKALSRTHRLVGFALVVFGLVLLARAFGGAFVPGLVWPVALFGAGVVLAHEQGVELTGRAGGAFPLRAVAGALVLLAGVVLAISLNFDLAAARDTFLVVGVVVAGLGLVLAPWVSALVGDLADERRARIRAAEREQVATHLHDSVLQTLSLIQRRADDPAIVGLARRQERELRSWLYGRGDTTPHGGFRAAIEGAMAEVEELHTVPVEVVVVGDRPLDEAHAGLVAAAREAATNAANHAGVDRVDVFAETGDGRTEVFVRDTGVGFDPTAIGDDRRGIADSIRGRVERLGGTVVIDTAIGAGTEVEFVLPWNGRHAVAEDAGGSGAGGSRDADEPGDSVPNEEW